MPAASAPPEALSFPPALFATLSPSPFLLAHLSSKSQIRANGRSPSTFRKPVINTNSLSHCNGSAVVRAGDTACVCGIRAEILRASDVADPSCIPTNLHTNDEDVAEMEEGADADADD
ncbi:hypothetical protein LTS18_011202, partial [Coniosporium uncinatum]